MTKYIILAVLALAIAAPSFGYAEDAAPKAAKHEKKEHKKAVKHRRAAKVKAEAAPAADAAPAATGGNK